MKLVGEAFRLAASIFYLSCLAGVERIDMDGYDCTETKVYRVTKDIVEVTAMPLQGNLYDLSECMITLAAPTGRNLHAYLEEFHIAECGVQLLLIQGDRHSNDIWQRLTCKTKPNILFHTDKDHLTLRLTKQSSASTNYRYLFKIVSDEGPILDVKSDTEVIGKRTFYYDDKLSAGAKAGVGAAVLLILLIIATVIAVVVWYYKKDKKQYKEEMAAASSTSSQTFPYPVNHSLHPSESGYPYDKGWRASGELSMHQPPEYGWQLEKDYKIKGGGPEYRRHQSSDYERPQRGDGPEYRRHQSSDYERPQRGDGPEYRRYQSSDYERPQRGDGPEYRRRQSSDHERPQRGDSPEYRRHQSSDYERPQRGDGPEYRRYQSSDYERPQRGDSPEYRRRHSSDHERPQRGDSPEYRRRQSSDHERPQRGDSPEYRRHRQPSDHEHFNEKYHRTRDGDLEFQNDPSSEPDCIQPENSENNTGFQTTV